MNNILTNLEKTINDNIYNQECSIIKTEYEKYEEEIRNKSVKPIYLKDGYELRSWEFGSAFASKSKNRHEYLMTTEEDLSVIVSYENEIIVDFSNTFGGSEIKLQDPLALKDLFTKVNEHFVKSGYMGIIEEFIYSSEKIRITHDKKHIIFNAIDHHFC